MEQSKFLEKFKIDLRNFEKTGLKWADLIFIKEQHEKELAGLEHAAKDISDRLRRASPDVHSVKYRVKDSEHLIEKIIRKKLEAPERAITPDSYKQEITDLIGVRVLHLFKDDWEAIHDFILRHWETHEDPIAYYRQGDTGLRLDKYKSKGCRPEPHKAGYRSIHYVVKTAPTKNIQLAEIQARTLFEEAWSEIDHKFHYPYGQENNLLVPYLTIFNQLAGSADAMGSYVQMLQAALDNIEAERRLSRKEYENKVTALERKIQELKIEANQKKEIEDELKSLKLQNEPWTSITRETTAPNFATSVMGTGGIFPSLNSEGMSETLKGLTSITAHMYGNNSYIGRVEPAELYKYRVETDGNDAIKIGDVVKETPAGETSKTDKPKK